MQPPETCPRCGSPLLESDGHRDLFKCRTFYRRRDDYLGLSEVCKEMQIARLTAELASVNEVARKAIDAARHYPLWSWTDVEAELAECEKQLAELNPQGAQ